MRPLQLTLSGFRSYDEETVDWRRHGLVVIAGDTGAGKSSLLDAICFALYGRTPELSGPKELLSLGRTHGEVRLTFARGDEVWRATRRFGPDAPEPLHLLERMAGDTAEVAEGMAGESVVSDRLRQLVGLRFEAFTSAVILAQGRFARFLAARPRERDDILRELFGVASLEGARAAALAAATASREGADALGAERGRLPAHGPAERARVACAARAAAARRAALAALVPAAAAAAAARDEAAAAEAEARMVGEAAARLPGAEALGALSARVAAAAEACDGAGAALADAARAAAAAVTARDAARSRHDGTAAELAGLRGDAGRLAELSAAIPPAEAEISRRRAGLAAEVPALEARAALARRAALASDLAAAEADRAALQAEAARAEAAAGAVEHAQRAHLAAVLRAGLAPGDPCPVCGAAVGALAPPEPARAGEAGAAEPAAARAAAEAAAARARAEGARMAAARAREALEAAGGSAGDDAEALRAQAGPVEDDLAAAQAAGGELTALAARLADDRAAAARLREGLGAWGAAGAEALLEAAVAELAGLDAAAERALGEEAAARRRDEAARRARDEIERVELARLRQDADRLAGRLGREGLDPGLGAAEAVDRAGALARRAARAAAALTARARRAGERAAAAEGRVAAEGAPLGVGRPADVAAAAAGARAARDDARRALAAIETTAAEGRRLAGLEGRARDGAERQGRVAADLQANRFPRYLLQRYRERLAVGASARLEELSGRRYRFAGSGADPLDVVDLARGEKRRAAATLSGGERFLASLALALGLGEVAAESGGRLDCLFLDEGFSSLDAESLEQALSGVERLAADGRLVVVITHMAGVVDRLGASIRVTKDPSGVSRVAA